jgi:hypothetical protein
MLLIGKPLNRFLLVLLFLSSNTLSSQILSQDQEQFLQEIDPRFYNQFKSAEALWQKGVEIVDYMNNQLESNRSLIVTASPKELIEDFNSKIRRIENLKGDLRNRNTQASYTTGLQIGNKFASGDVKGGVTDIAGAIGQLREQQRAKEALVRQQILLRQELTSKMNEVYENAQMSANAQKMEFYKLAAYSFSILEEDYYLKYVENINCFQESMKKQFDPDSSDWLDNNCSYPNNKPSLIENTFVAKDIQYSQAARRKVELYKKNSNYHFLIAARSFMSGAVKLKPSSAYYKELISYYDAEKEAFEVLALSNTLEKKFPSDFQNSDNIKLETAKRFLVNELVLAIRENDNELIEYYLDKGIDTYINNVVNKTPLRLAVENDAPDAVQLILNKQLSNKSQEDQQAILQRTILMASALNSYKTIERFVTLGVPIEFTLKQYTPVIIASKSNSTEALNILLNSVPDKSKYNDIINGSSSYHRDNFIRAISAKDFNRASLALGDLTSKMRNEVLISMKSDFVNQPIFIKALNKSSKVNEGISQELRNFFNDLFVVNVIYNLSDLPVLFLENELVDIDKVLNISTDEVERIWESFDTKYFYGSKQVLRMAWSPLNMLMVKQAELYFLGEKGESLEFDSSVIRHYIDNLSLLIEQSMSNKELLTPLSVVEGAKDSFGNRHTYKQTAESTLFSLFGYLDSNDYRYSNRVLCDVCHIDYYQMINRVLNHKSIHSSIITNKKLKILNVHPFYSEEFNSRVKHLSKNKEQEFDSLDERPMRVLDFILLKNDDNLISYIIENLNIDWNETAWSQRPRFLQLALTLNWNMLDKLYSIKGFDYSLTDQNGNNILHYVAEHYWLTRKYSRHKYPEYLLPEFFKDLNTESLKSKKNNFGIFSTTPFSMFKNPRMGEKWSKSFKERVATYLE